MNTTTEEALGPHGRYAGEREKAQDRLAESIIGRVVTLSSFLHDEDHHECIPGKCIVADAKLWCARNRSLR